MYSVKLFQYRRCQGQLLFMMGARIVQKCPSENIFSKKKTARITTEFMTFSFKEFQLV